MSTGHKLFNNDDSKEVDQTTYRSMIGKLQYVVHTRPNIALVVSMVARFSANSKENHMMEIKRIMRYLKNTKEYGLWYNLRGNLDLNVFTNVDWVGSLKMTKKTLVVENYFLVKDQCLGQVRNIIVSLIPQQRKSMWHQQLIIVIFFGSNTY